jgi:membrane protein YdbS with pleckstrin-like domain
LSASTEDLEAALPEPAQRLSPMARRAWRLSAALVALPVAAAAMWARLALELPIPLPLAWAGIALALVVFVGIAPEVSWRRWRYEIRPLEIDLRRGLVVVRRTLVPIARVQHVDTERGPLQRALGLATVTFHTAAGKNEIPHLAEAEADRVRVLIAELTRQPDVT